MTRHRLAATTHTVMLTQLAEINARLADRRKPPVITFADLDLPDENAFTRLPGSAALEELSCSGDPEWPLIRALFRSGAVNGDPIAIQMHTPALRKLSHLLGLRQVWGI